MNAKIIIGAVTVIVVAIVGGVMVGMSNQSTGQQYSEDEVVNEQQNQSQSSQVDEASTRSNNAYVIVDGQEQLVAEAIPFDAQAENFETTKDYQEAYVSPTGRFVAFQAAGFERMFVQVYDAATDTLHDNEAEGSFQRWTDDERIELETCGLAGEPGVNCTEKISVNSERPWEFEVVRVQGEEQAEDISSRQNGFDSEADFITNITDKSDTTEFGSLLEEYAPRAINGTGPFTLFVPTNGALEDVIPDDATDEEIVDFIRNHVAAPEYRFSEFSAENPVNTTGNDRLSFVQESGVVRINNRANIIQPDLESSNGIVHVIDDTVIPLNR